MKTAFYWKFAFAGMQKNRRLYLPYLFSAGLMVMMQYLICFLSYDEEIRAIPGGEQMQVILSMGIPIVTIFGAIFLFYTNAFLVRRRKKEFGLYNMLGMAKGNLAKVLFCETLMTVGIALVSGNITGILFSKAIQMVMADALGQKVGFYLTINPSPIVFSVVVFTVIFFLIYLNGLRQIHMTSPVELLKSESAGEKPPKSNPLMAILGAILLGAGYWIAISMEDPMSAIVFFFLAVILVIMGTYLLFVSGSVVLCRLLQSNKRFYYNKKHFISVSAMAYRMKRNGAGLASICILSTAVLVMLSSTSCLLLGGEDLFQKRYPRDIVMNISGTGEDKSERLSTLTAETAKESDGVMENPLQYRYLSIAVGLEGDKVITIGEEGLPEDMSTVIDLMIIPIDDYNQVMGKQVTLGADEALLCVTKIDYRYDTITVDGFGTLKVKERLSEGVPNSNAAMEVFPSFYLIVNDIEAYKGEKVEPLRYFYCFDVPGEGESEVVFTETFRTKLTELMASEDWGDLQVRIDGREENRAHYFSLYKGLFVLAIILGGICLGAAVLIMYYKQISEGYEDQARFAIMQKVGMTKKEISGSVNSQVLTVFFAPLLGAGAHMAAAFHIVWLLLTAFGLTNSSTLMWITIGCYFVFGLFYTVVYFITSRSYYGIVSK